MLVEVVPPHPGLSGITVNPVVIPMSAGRQALVSLRYTAAFRDLTAASMANLNKAQPKADSGENEEGMPKGLVARNKKIAERLEKKKADASNAAAAAQADPKKRVLWPQLRLLRPRKKTLRLPRRKLLSRRARPESR